jgi:hypothetical protein
MTPLSEAERRAAKSIAAALVGQEPRTIARAYSAAMNHMLAKLLLAHWQLEPAGARALAFGDAVLAELDRATSRKLVH